MQAKKKNGERPRISVSLDPEDYEWVENLSGLSGSLSYKLSRIVKAARLSGLTLEDAKSAGILQQFSDFLGNKRKNKLAAEMNELLTEFLKMP